MEQSYKIIIAGDLIPSGKNIKLFEEGDAEEIFSKEVVAIFQNADFSVVNLEGALTDSVVAKQKVGPNIKAPLKSIEGIRNLGVKAVALANNHITDYGNIGYADTINAFEQAGIIHFGSGSSKTNVKTHISVECGERKICIYNVSETFFNVPDNANAGVNIYDEWLVLNEIKQLKTNHDYIIVMYHGGAEHFLYPTPQTRKRFHRMAECGADIVISQHTHCIGCEEFYKDSYLLYGQGNFSFARQKESITREGLILEIVFDKTVSIKKHRIEMLDSDCLKYSDNQDFNDLFKRSEQIYDEGFIISQYRKIDLAQNRFANRYLYSYRGISGILMRKILPTKIWNKWIKSYTAKQVLCNLYAAESDRVREDLIQCWYALDEKII